MATHKVGGEVDAFCTRCKMTLAHTILAMVGTKVARVKCNTCGGDHAYRGEPGKTSSKPRKSRAAGGVAKTIISWQERVDAKNPASAKKYSTKETFVAEDLLEHPTFGVGIVSAVRGDKIDVAFKGEQKTLMHGKSGGAPADKPKFAPPTASASGPADKPQKDDPDAPAGEAAPATDAAEPPQA